VEAVNEGTVRAGDTVLFRAGSYGAPAPEYQEIAAGGLPGAPITFAGCPGDPKPAISGWFILKGDHVTVSGFVFDGPTGAYPANDGSRQDQAPVEIQGDDVTLTGSEIRESQSGGGLLVGASTDPAVRFTIAGNWIHDNGEFSDPGEANLHHGIYAQYGSGLIANNLIAHNYASGVQLYPSPSGVLVGGNTIVGNGRAGVIVGAERGPPAPTGNRIVGNVIAGNSHAVVASGPIGAGNVVEANRIWDNAPPVFHDPPDALIVLDNEAHRPRLAAADYFGAGAGLPRAFDVGLALGPLDGACA
jgi:hypothetical protein